MATQANARSHGDDSSWGKGKENVMVAKQSKTVLELSCDKDGEIGSEKYALLSEHRMVFGKLSNCNRPTRNCLNVTSSR